eukprot:NODE_9766_length_1401_cov_3.112245.p2 GENE.NODE_9766_length_1401_cov_3.112245~~NODE_9766_length_1401_cov_3.112245.p2  ORF type:complete len:304 (+),score=71.49 NODE_9766_length_1401_cov_3.112245:276-1187(+)
MRHELQFDHQAGILLSACIATAPVAAATAALLEDDETCRPDAAVELSVDCGNTFTARCLRTSAFLAQAGFLALVMQRSSVRDARGVPKILKNTVSLPDALEQWRVKEEHEHNGVGEEEDNDDGASSPTFLRECRGKAEGDNARVSELPQTLFAAPGAALVLIWLVAGARAAWVSGSAATDEAMAALSTESSGAAIAVVLAEVFGPSVNAAAAVVSTTRLAAVDRVAMHLAEHCGGAIRTSASSSAAALFFTRARGIAERLRSEADVGDGWLSYDELRLWFEDPEGGHGVAAECIRSAGPAGLR